MNVTKAHVDVSGCIKSGMSTRCTTYGELLSNEIFRRSKVSWTVEPSGTSRSTSIELSIDPKAGVGTEGYILSARMPARTANSSAALAGLHGDAGGVTVIGRDEAGLLFGVGRLLRLLAPSQSEGYKVAPSRTVLLPMPVGIKSAPGHQVGYRPKTNSYDGWTAEDYEQYVVDLAIFGTNMIELIPWKTDDVPFSPMFTLDPSPMLAAVSNADYTDKATLKAAKAEWAEVFANMKRLDMVQIPAGDPGKRPPNELLAIGAIFSDALKTAFPKATLWIGPQEWSPTEMAEWNAAIATGVEWMDG
eukprot:gene17406-7191_t